MIHSIEVLGILIGNFCHFVGSLKKKKKKWAFFKEENATIDHIR